MDQTPPVGTIINFGHVTIKRAVDWPSLFELIRERPGLWMGRPTLEGMSHLIDGIRLAEDLYDVPEERRLGGFPFDEYEDWAAERFNPERLTVRAYDLALRAADSDEEAFALWFTWYDRFRRERADS